MFQKTVRFLSLFSAVLMFLSLFARGGWEVPADNPPGAIIAPEIVVKQNSDKITDGSVTYDFGSVEYSEDGPDVEFTIENTSAYIPGITKIEIDNAENFTLEDSATKVSLELNVRT